MKFSLPLQIVGLATVGLTAIAPAYIANAQTYGEKEVEESNFVVVAAPFGEGRYNLLIIEQITNKQKCWSETGSTPTIVDPLLLNFNFAGICDRKTDSNGYSIRIDGEDYGLEYRLDVVKRENELYLIGSPGLGGNKPEIVLGKTNGMAEGFLKIELEPGWRLTKRTYQNKTLGHIYFTGDSTAFGTPGGPAPVFRDIARDIYRGEIEKAVKLGFISGFEDKTFRPREALTRAQLVSMIYEVARIIPEIKVAELSQPTVAPFSDVPTSHWAAAKIKWAQDNDIVSGYKDVSFRPNQPVTRAELMIILNKMALYVQKITNKGDKLITTSEPFFFSDISGHWSERRVLDMSAYCKVATPLNESGNAFYPDSPSQRNYAAAATLRMLNCLKPPANQP